MKLIIRKASVRWKSGVKDGSRTVTTESGALKASAFSSDISLKSKTDTSPSELIAAAHAISFSRALSHELGLKASALGEIVTTATVTLENLVAGWTIINIHLNVIAHQ